MNKFTQFKVFRAGKTISIVFVIINGIICLSANPAVAEKNNHLHHTLADAFQDDRISLDVSNRSIKYILNEVCHQIKTNFLLKDEKQITEELSSLSIKVTNATVSESLDKLLYGTNFTYILYDNTIIILRRDQQTSQQSPQKNRTFVLSGTVIDNAGKPISRATITALSSGKCVASDARGMFEIEASLGEQIEVKYLSMVTRIITIESLSAIVVELKQDIIKMEDVVITGYGKVKRSSYTGNAITVSQDDLLKVSKTNIIAALQTFDPSFRIIDNNQWGSDPNSLPEVSIRGGSSLGVRQAEFNGDGTLGERLDLRKNNLEHNSNLPIFIMDGFEISISKLYDFDLNRILSITLLKDAAATALYGSRAANGVVVITTIAPNPGKLSVSYNIVATVVAPDLSDYNMLNAAEKLEVERLAGCYDNIRQGRSTHHSQLELDQEYNAKLLNVKRGVDTYWLSKPLKTALNHKHSIYVDGGSESIRFGFDAQYHVEDGVMRGSYRNRMGVGFYVQYNYKRLSIRNYTSFLGTQSQESPFGAFSSYVKQLPYNTFLNEDGSIAKYLMDWDAYANPQWRKAILNPLYEASLQNFDRNKLENITNNLIINWRLDHLLWKVQFSVQRESGNTRIFKDPLSSSNIVASSGDAYSSGHLQTGFQDRLKLDMNTTLSYFVTSNGHDLNSLVGFELNQDKDEQRFAQYSGFPSGSLSSVNYAQKQIGKTKYHDGISRRIGILASINYSYQNIYLLDLSMRIDGSSIFGANKRYALFGSVGVGLNIHNYKFMQDNRLFNQLKIRGSYGQVGKANFKPYDALITYDILADEWYKTGYGSSLKAFGNPNLKWETTNTFDIGFEAKMFKNRLYLHFSYYDKKTIDLINRVTIPVSTGFKEYMDNIGEISNRGFEVEFRIEAVKTSDMALFVNGNWGRNRNKILKISDSMKEYNRKVQDMYKHGNPYNAVLANPLMQFEEGGSLYSIWGVPSLGINPTDGQEIFLQRDGSITNIWNTMDQVIIGNREAKGRGSVGLNFLYKRWSFYSSFMYEYGGQRYNETLADKVENVSVYNTNVDRRVLDERWKQPGDNAKYKALDADRMNLAITKPTSRFVQDYNILSLTSMEIGYDVSQGTLDNLGFSGLRIMIGTNDLFHLSSIKQERGIEYPYARRFNITVKLSF